MSTREAPISTKAGWPVFTTTLESRQEVAGGTMAFRFAKPSGWGFEAGQFIDMDLIDPPKTDAEGNTRGFSIASAPFEDTIMIATRMRDTAFKQVLKTLPIGGAVTVEGPFGNLTLHHNAARPAVVLSGGIGITPFRSILLQAAKDQLPHRIFLFYANRRPEDTPFLDDMHAVERENPNFTFIPTMGQMDTSTLPWAGETGLIDAGMLSRHLTGVASPIYYIAGPPGMVQAMQTVLRSTGVDTDDIRVEEFTGY